MSTPIGASAAPVSLRERLEHIDILRGIALLGVLAMNLHFWFRAPMARYRLESHPWPGFFNVATDWGLEALVAGKALATFAMLFAVGLAIQMERAEARGQAFGRFGFRRLGALFAFGVLHLLLVWNGDILHNYAIVGLISLAFLRRKVKTILIWLGVLLGLAVLAILVFSVIQGLRPPPEIHSAKGIEKTQALLRETLQIRGSGTWVAELQFRLREYVRIFGPGGELVSTLDIFIKFLVGLAIWKSGVLHDPSAHLPRLRRFFAWTLGAGLMLSLLATLAQEHIVWILTHWKTTRFFLPVMGISQIFGPLILALGWASGVLLLLQRRIWQDLLRPFADVGRMALTNYLTQSLVMTFVFFGWGLGLYNTLGPFAGLCLSVGFFALQALLSRWWLARFQFGPVEWAWRSITYGRPQPLRRAPAPLADVQVKAPEPA